MNEPTEVAKPQSSVDVENIPLDDAPTPAAATAAAAPANHPPAAAASGTNSSSTLTWVAQQLREEMGVASPSMGAEVVICYKVLDELHAEQRELVARVSQLTDAYVALRVAIEAMGSVLYDMGIRENETLREPLIRTGDSLRGVAHAIDLSVQLKNTLEALSLVGKVVQDARDTREAHRKARLLHDGLVRSGAAEGEVAAAAARLQDLQDVLLLKVSLARQHSMQSVIRQVEQMRVALREMFAAASEHAQAQELAPSQGRASIVGASVVGRAGTGDGPQTKELERILN